MPYIRLQAASRIVVAAAVLGLAPTATSAQSPNEAPADPLLIEMPKRRAPDGPPSAPPEVPKHAAIAPATLSVTVARGSNGRARTVRQTVSRTAERIHIAESGKREWLFERNPVDPRRVSATLVDHAAQTVVVYEESDLRITLGIRGWVDVLALGFDPRSLNGYRRTADARRLGPVQFTRYVSTNPKRRADEVWWSDEQALASTFAVGDSQAATRFEIVGARAGVDATLLRPSSSRFPAYRVVSLADWLEKH